MLNDLVLTNRSYRRFYQNFLISEQVLLELVNLARLSPSAKNAQPLKYILSFTKEKNEKIFPTLAWAAYLKDWQGPEEGERPSAYIIMLLDKSITSNYYCDHGIAAQSILLGANEKGLGGCIIANISREKLAEALHIANGLEIIQIIALGKPKETVVIEPLGLDGKIEYWRDENQVHHVPKRSMDEIIIKN